MRHAPYVVKGALNNDAITISGTALPDATVTLSRSDLGVLPNPVTADSLGHWTYNYSGMSLAGGVYNLTATQFSGGLTSAASADFPVTISTAAPTLTLSLPAAPIYSLAPPVQVFASDPAGLPNGTSVTLTVQELAPTVATLGSATGTLTNGWTSISLLPSTSLAALVSSGTFTVSGSLTDPAGNTGTSATDTFTIAPSGTSLLSAQVLTSDPLQGNAQLELGNVQATQLLDLDKSPGTTQSGNTQLVYNLASASIEPVLQATFLTNNTTALPTTFTLATTWDGVPLPGEGISLTPGAFNPGDQLVFGRLVQPFLFGLTTGRHDWSESVTFNYSTPITYVASGSTFIVNEESSPFGAGWTLSSVNQLVSIPADTINSAPGGELMIYGTGGFRYFADGASTATFTSPANDNGTLTFNGSAYTYTTPAGDSTTFNSSGYQTQWTSADGQQTLQYRYNGSNQLTGTTAIDGALATFTYSGGVVSSLSAPEGTTSFTETSVGLGHDLTEISLPVGVHTFTYSGQLLTDDAYGVLESSYAYSAVGSFLATYTSSGQVNATLRPSNVQGLNFIAVAGSDSEPVGSATDGDGNTTLYQQDGEGRMLVQQVADGGTTTYQYSAAGEVTTMTDPLDRTTTYAYDSSLYLTELTNPDATTETDAYQTAFHALTETTDENGNATHYAYDSEGHQTSVTNALGQTTTYGYNSSGEMTSVTDHLNHTTTYTYDSERRLSTTTDPMSGLTTLTYDSYGHVYTTTDALGNTTTMLNNALGRTTETIDPVGDTTYASYDASGLQLSSTDADGYETDTSYNSGGQVTSTEVAANSTVPSITLTTYDNAGNDVADRDAMGNWTGTGYDAVNRVTAVVDVTSGATSLTKYDLAGDATATVTALGYVTDQSFDVRGRLTASTDPLGHTTSTLYDGVGNVTVVIDPLGHRTTTAYDALNRVTQTTNADGYTNDTAFDAACNVTETIDGDGNETTYAYDPNNWQTSETDAVGTTVQATTTMAYDKVGNDTATTNADNQTTYNYFDPADRQTLTVDALGLRTTMALDHDGNDTLTTAPGNLMTTMVYDGQDRLVKTTDPAGDTTDSFENADDEDAEDVDADGHVTTEYDNSRGNVVVSIDGTGAATEDAYDLDDNQVSTTDGDGNATDYYYDKDDRQIMTVDSLGNTTYSYYDHAGQLTQTVDADGHSTSYGYDAAGQQTSVTDEYGKTSYTYYDGNGNVTQTTDADSNNTYYYFDAQGRQTAVKEPSGQYAYTDYDLAGNVTETVDDNSHASYSGYDAADRVTSTTDGNGNISYQYYDEADHVTQTVSGTGQSTTYAFDGDGRQTSVTDPLGHTAYTYYDADGRVTQMTDALTDTTETGYDGDGRVTSQTDGDGNTTTTTYDKDGNTLSVTDPDTNVTQYQYNSVDEQTLMIAPNGSHTTTSYDDAGNVTMVVDGDSRTTTYSYDDNNRETGETWKNSGGTTTDALTFTYDNAGNQLTAADSAGTVTLGYNSDNQATSQTDVFGLRTTYSYDGNGNIAQRLDSLGGTTSYSFDGNNNLATVMFSGTGQSPVRADLTYTADNELSSLTRYDSLTASSGNVVGTTVYSYDNADRVTAITTKNSTSTTLAYYDYAYDAANRVTVLTTLSGGAETFTYDSASQLLSDHLNGSAATTYSYDSNGNRNMSGYSTSTGNETTNDGTYTYTFDNVGNLTEQAAATGGTVMYYTYNQKNQIASIEVTSNGTTAVSWTTFAYDALNRRIEQDTWQSGVGNSTTRMAYDINGQVWADLNGSNALQTRYLMGIGLQQYFAREDGSGNVYWLVQNSDYSVCDILNSAGADVDTIEFTAYGNIVSQTTPTDSGVILYAAYRYYLGANVYLDGQRVYGPADGKFYQNDPIMFTAGDPNLYRYVRNDPTNATDPSGLAPAPKDEEDSPDYAARIEKNQGFAEAIKSGNLNANNVYLKHPWHSRQIDFTFEKAYVGTFTHPKLGLSSGAYIKLVAHVTEGQYDEVRLVQVARGITQSADQGWNGKERGHTLTPRSDEQKARGGWSDPDTPYRGWFVDVPANAKLPYYDNKNSVAGFPGGKTKDAVLYDSPLLPADVGLRSVGQEFITVAVGFKNGDKTGYYLGAIRWGTYIGEDGVPSFWPSTPDTYPEGQVPPEFAAALDRWNKLPKTEVLNIRGVKVQPEPSPQPQEELPRNRQRNLENFGPRNIG